MHRLIEGESETEDNKKSRKHKPVGYIQSHINELMISLAVHMLILFLISFFVVEQLKSVKNLAVIITVADPITDMVKVEEPRLKTEPEELSPRVEPEPMEKPMELEETVETREMIAEVPNKEAQVDSVSPMDALEAPPMAMGLPVQGPTGGGLPAGIRSRTPVGKKRSTKVGNDGSLEFPLALALQWLAEHQEQDGSWDALKYEGKWEGRVAITGVALLAFLGDGNSENDGPYKKTVRKGIAWLNKAVAEKADPPHFDNNYGSAIALMALSEAVMFGSRSETRNNANRLASMFVNQYRGQAWRYEDGREEDQSVSGWIALGLKSAKSAKLEAVQSDMAVELFKQYEAYVISMTPPETGLGKYTRNGESSPHMTWVGMTQRHFLGFVQNDHFMTRATENSQAWLASQQWIGGDVLGDCYGIYYGTLAAFQTQGPFWKAWNTKMKHSLPKAQRQGDPRLLGGSWDPTVGQTSMNGGRVMMTALMALCMEIYYRHELMN